MTIPRSRRLFTTSATGTYTFVYTGHDLKASGLFLEGGAEERATQTAGRYSLHRLDSFKINTQAQQVEWAGIIQAMEDALLLYRHQSGDLAKHWRYLHDRTGGTLAALSDLIREAADEAIETGTETITKTIMDHIVLGQRAEARYAQIRKRAKGSGQPRFEDPQSTVIGF